MRLATIYFRRFDCNGPWLAIWTQTQRTHLPVDADQSGVDAMVGERLSQAIYAKAFRDAVQVNRDRLLFEYLIAIYFNQVVCRMS